jgi:superfamily II DNA or RNA helicase
VGKRENLRLIKSAKGGYKLLQLIDRFGATELRTMSAHEFVDSSMMNIVMRNKLRELIHKSGVQRVEEMLAGPAFVRLLRGGVKSADMAMQEETRRRLRVFVLAPGFELPDASEASSPGAPRPAGSARANAEVEASSPAERAPPRTPAGAQKSAAVRLLEGMLPGVRDKSSLNRWAHERHVLPWLQVPARIFNRESSPEARHWLQSSHGRRATLERVLLDQIETSLGAAPTRPVPAELRQTAVLTLQRAARATQEALDHEAERENGPQIAPEAPALRALWTKLTTIRAAMREHVPPGLAGSRAEMLLAEEPSRIIVTEPVRAWCAGAHTPTVEIHLDLESRRDTVRCDCPRPRGSGCSVRIAAIDLVLEALSNPQEPEFRNDLLAAVGVAGWSYALGELDQLLDDPGVTAVSEGLQASAQLGWRIKTTAEGDLQLEPVEVLPAKTGGQKTRSLDPRVVAQQPGLLATSIDRRVFELFEQIHSGKGSNPYAPPLRETTLNAVHRAVASLVGHPRVFFGGRSAVPLSVRETPIRLHWQDDVGGTLSIRVSLGTEPVEDLAPFLARAQTQRHADRLVLLDENEGSCRVVPMTERAMGLLGFLHRRGTEVEAEAVPALMERLPTISGIVPVHLDEALRGAERKPSLRPLVQLEILAGGGASLRWRVRPEQGGSAFFAGKGPMEIHGAQGEQRWTIVRRAEDERRAVQAAKEAVLARAELSDAGLAEQDIWTLADSEDALRCIEALQGLSEELDLSWAGPRRRVVDQRQAADLRISVRGLEHWFEVGGELVLDGAELGLEELLSAVRDNRSFVEVHEGTWMRINESMRSELDALASAVWSTRRGLEISPMHAPALDALAELGVEVDAVPEWTLRMDRIHAVNELQPELPDGLEAQLRNYQRVGFEWLVRMAHWADGACLADDMGLGKTVQALALLLHRADEGPALVVAPTSVGFNWVRECESFAPSLTPHRYRGPDREELLTGLGPGDVVITNYALLARDDLPLSAIGWGTVVLDEAQAIKNPGTQTAKAAFALDSGFRLALTGTPVENRSGDLWSLMRFLVPGYLGSRAQFKKRFAVPIERHGNTKRQDQLAGLVRPFVLRRLKSEVAKELPERTEVTLHVELSPDERALYEEQRQSGLAALSKGGDGPSAAQRMQALAALTRLRQLACHPRLLDPESEIPSSKLQALRELVEELHAEGHRCLIFSQFTRHLGLVRDALVSDGFTLRYLDGSTPEAERHTEVDRFQAGDGDAFLISLKAGGTGLNLTAATYVIHLDPWWNPAAEDQASDRTHRIGQHNPVTVYRLISTGTVEEAVVQLQASKRALIAGLLDGTTQSANLSADDILDLMRDP